MMGSEVTRERKSVCVVTPCFNEQDVIPLFFEELSVVMESEPSYEFTVVMVDDGSRDSTTEILCQIAGQDERLVPISLARNFGHQVALSAGLEFADADAVIMMDSDLQHPPSLIPQMLRAWEEGAEIVSTVRTKTEDASFLKNLSSRGYYAVLKRLTNVPIIEGAADFCLLSRVAHQALISMPEKHRFLRGMVSWIGFRRTFIPFDAPGRAAGESKYTLRKMLGMALDGAFSFSTAPMRMCFRLGACVMLGGASYLMYIIVRHFTVGDLVTGWASLISSMLILQGMQFMVLGVISEYLGRIFDEAKGRPLYVTRPLEIPGRENEDVIRPKNVRNENVQTESVG